MGAAATSKAQISRRRDKDVKNDYLKSNTKKPNGKANNPKKQVRKRRKIKQVEGDKSHSSWRFCRNFVSFTTEVRVLSGFEARIKPGCFRHSSGRIALFSCLFRVKVEKASSWELGVNRDSTPIHEMQIDFNDTWMLAVDGRVRPNWVII